MFIKHRLGGCLAVLILMPALTNPAAHAQSANKGENAREDQRSGKDFTPIPRAERQQTKPAIYLPDCAQPKDHNEADLCEQMRMADAAKDAVRVGYWQIGVGMAATIVGSLAAVFAGWAAYAASQAASASRRSADIAERALRGLERPYLFVKILNTDALRNPIKDVVPALGYTLANYGRTPAILRSISIVLEYNPEWPLRTPMAVAEEMYEVIEAGGELAKSRAVKVRNGEPGERFAGKAGLLFLHGLLQYQGATGEFYSEPFRLQGNDGGSTFRIME